MIQNIQIRSSSKSKGFLPLLTGWGLALVWVGLRPGVCHAAAPASSGPPIVVIGAGRPATQPAATRAANQKPQPGVDYSQFAYEAGADVPGVKTVEGNPADGLRYRVRMRPTATKDKPDRLLIWLHPSGESMNGRVEALATKLVAHHVALIVFTQKDWNHWTAEDVKRMSRSVVDAGKIPGISLAAKPLVLGYDGGGYLEMILYQQNPRMFGGLAFDGISPLNIVSKPPLMYAHPPDDPAIKSEPLLVMAGAQDPAAAIWGFVADNWKKAGAPLKLVVVPGKRHQCLFDDADGVKLLTDWIDQASAMGIANAAGALGPPATPLIYDPAHNTAYLAGGQHRQDLSKRLAEQMQQGQWADALATDDALADLSPQDGTILYNRACILARLGRAKEAMTALDQSIASGFVDSDHIASDDDLQSLHGNPDFSASALAKRIDVVYSHYPTEPGADMPDVKTVEAIPAGGLHYRLRMSKSATAAHPDRLVVWFHPTGWSMDQAIEALSPDLAKRRLAVVVFPQKSYMGWTPEDAKRVLVSVQSIGKIAGIDARRPIMLGFSAGGQTILDLYENDPGALGGVVLDASYPLQTANGNVALAQPPANPAVKGTPMLAVVGTADPQGRLWPLVEHAWRDKGVPLTLKLVPDRRHEWLFDNDERKKMLIDWMSDAAAGKLSTAPAPSSTTKPAA